MRSDTLPGTPKVGDKAPNFTLPSHVGGRSSKVNLSDYVGKKIVVLAFYPKDETPGCTKEMCSFSEDLSRFESADAVVLGISCDNIDSHQQFASKFNLQQPLLADVDGKVAKQYGAISEGKSTANRITFVIDKQGSVCHIVDGMPTNSQLIEIIEELK